MRAFELTGLKVDNFNDSRFAAALDFFRDGKTLEFEGTVFVLDSSQKVVDVMKLVEHATLDVDSASVEMSRAMEVYGYVRQASAEFSRITDEYIPRFSLVNDYGMGSVEICHLQNGKLVWNT